MKKNKISIIAEFCQNHNGNINILNKMIEKAAESGATHAKVQNIFAKELTFRPCFEKGIKIKNKIVCIKRPYKNEYERLKKLELNYKQLERFVEKCKKFQLIPLITCFTKSQIDLLSKIGFKTIKIASYDCSSFQFLREANKKFTNLIVSTGATYDDEIQKAAQILKSKSFTFLHCITIYPTPLKDINLNRIKFLKKFTKNVGNPCASDFQFSYSDTDGSSCHYTYAMDPEWEGYMLLFPSRLEHCVFPYYISDDVRISISGNVSLNSENITRLRNPGWGDRLTNREKAAFSEKIQKERFGK